MNEKWQVMESLKAVIWAYRYERHKWGFYNNAEIFECNHFFCANSSIAWKKEESDPVSSPLTVKAGTFSRARYLYSVCKQLHSQGAVGSCYSQSGPTAKCLTGALERWAASTFGFAQYSATWQSFGVASCSPPSPCCFLGHLLTSRSSWPVLVSPSQGSWLDSVPLLFLLTWQICNSPLFPQVLLLMHSIFQCSDISVFSDFYLCPALMLHPCLTSSVFYIL